MAELKRKNGRGALVRLGILIALVVGGAVAASATPLGDYLSREGVGRAIAWLQGSAWAPVIFIALYAGATALAMPGSVLTLAGGALFGVFWGTLYNTVGANVGANLAFGVGRFLGRDGVKRLAGDRLDALDRATTNHGFRGLFTLRLIPVVPFNALNFGSGLTSMTWPTYALATLLGIFPGTVVYTFFADALLAGSQEASREAFLRVLLAGLLLVLLSFLPTLARKLGVKVPGGPEDDAGSGGDGRRAPVTGAVLLALGAALAGGRPGAAAQSVPDHDAFTAVLEGVVRRPRVDYALLKERRSGLDSYLARLAAADPAALEAAPREVRLAFWINAYNACMLKLVVDHYPIATTKSLLGRLTNAVADRPANSVWQIADVFKREHCRVAGEDRSQDEIEHEIIRPIGDARIHFAVNCAARSCPPIWPEAYTPERLDEQLDRAVRSVVTDPAHFSVERDGGATVRLNKVMDWFKEDFGGVSGLRDFLAPYLPAETAKILKDPATKIDFFDYDWTLNDVTS